MDNSLAGRMNFNVAYSIFKDTFKNKWAAKMRRNPEEFDPASVFRLTQSRLRLEQPFVINSNTYNFPILNNIQNQAQQFNTEVRLTQQDSFVPTAIAVYVGAPTGTNDDTFELKSYLSPFVFGAANAVAMEPLYNGQMNWLINQIQYLVSWPVQWHKHVPQTQQTAAVGAGSPIDQFDGSMDGMKDMQPYILLIGTDNIKISIVTPLNCTAITANSRIILTIDGILAQNSSAIA